MHIILDLICYKQCPTYGNYYHRLNDWHTFLRRNGYHFKDGRRTNLVAIEMVAVYATRVTVAAGADFDVVLILSEGPEVAYLTRLTMLSRRPVLTVDTHAAPPLLTAVGGRVEGGVVDALGRVAEAFARLALVGVDLVPPSERFVVGQHGASLALSARNRKGVTTDSIGT